MTQTSELLLWPILVLGVFNFFWVPVANYAGKRPVFVLASGLLCACYIWGALAGSFQSLLWSNIVAAFAGSSTEALGASIVNDLYFLHERGSQDGHLHGLHRRRQTPSARSSAASSSPASAGAGTSGSPSS